MARAIPSKETEIIRRILNDNCILSLDLQLKLVEIADAIELSRRELVLQNEKAAKSDMGYFARLVGGNQNKERH